MKEREGGRFLRTPDFAGFWRPRERPRFSFCFLLPRANLSSGRIYGLELRKDIPGEGGRPRRKKRKIKRQKARVARKASCFSFRTRLFPSLSPPETQQQNVSSSMLCGATLRRCCSRQTLLARRAEIYRAGPLSREGAKMAVCAHTFPPSPRSRSSEASDRRGTKKRRRVVGASSTTRPALMERADAGFSIRAPDD